MNSKLAILLKDPEIREGLSALKDILKTPESEIKILEQQSPVAANEVRQWQKILS